ncbi:polysaccharide deacetylase family protein [Xanthobacter sp. V4C-4]|uniref:polysaccharide deacetylase family protein n=1 Tax=Xanthobacter cornucopiae TaxID=3119924 RepID=UPI00372C158E
MNSLPAAPPLVQLAQAAPPTGSFAPFTSSDAAAKAAAAVVAEPVAGAAPGTPTPAGGAVLAAPSAAVGMQAPAAAGAASGHRFPAYTSVDVDGPYIAITFDDGPNPETTPKLLKMLEARGVKATFFVVGTRASENPDLLRRMVAEGHEVGNHSWNHPQLPKVSVAEADRQVADTSAAIRAAIGKDPLYIRPPYGAMTSALRKHIEDKFGLAMVYWSADSLDWKNRDAQAIYDKVMAQTRAGGIILMHDIHATTVAAVPRVLDALLAKGYKFVTVSDLIAMHKPAPAKEVAALAPPVVRKKPKPAATANAPKPVKPVAASASNDPVAPRPAAAVKRGTPPSSNSSLF